MAETIEQWYQMIEETYNKWESQLAQLKSEKLLADSILQKDDLETDQREELTNKIKLLNNNINSIRKSILQIVLFVSPETYTFSINHNKEIAVIIPKNEINNKASSIMYIFYYRIGINMGLILLSVILNLLILDFSYYFHV